MIDKYANDKYDRERYIPKGYILPDGTMLTKQYARFHRDMAERFVMENYYQSFKNDIIKDKQDYMLMRLGAMQVMSSGKSIILFCDEHQSRIIQEAIASYLEHGWEQRIIANPYASVNDYLRSRILEGTELFYEEDKYEEKTGYSKILKRHY
ncbi:MAG: hypothetical protein GX265_01415 [Mollicutes bacterium]|nr:hypothetical protein [Mollicutes bacterium]